MAAPYEKLFFRKLLCDPAAPPQGIWQGGGGVRGGGWVGQPKSQECQFDPPPPSKGLIAFTMRRGTDISEWSPALPYSWVQAGCGRRVGAASTHRIANADIISTTSIWALALSSLAWLCM